METETISIVWAALPDGQTSVNVKSEETSIAGNDKRTIYLYLDEYGNFDFGKNGTKYFIMTCVAISRPFRAAHALMDLRYDLLEEGLCLGKFHACEDTNPVRISVYEKVAAHQSGFTAYSVCIDKATLPDSQKNAMSLYANAFSIIMDEVREKECFDVRWQSS